MHSSYAALAACAGLSCLSAAAQDNTRIEVTGHYNNAVGTSDAASQGVIEAALLKSRPALRPGEVLEFVPGLIVTQHSGDGKANQYFLRGFNLDHGTDFATRVNGMPVNMPTHAHGQGYTDLNFLLPELVQRIEYRKGPYFAGYGDFASAGAADIVYRRRFDEPFAQLTLGSHGFRRGVAGGSAALAGDTVALAALEVMHNDGPWAVPERLKKANGVMTFSGGTTARGWSTSLMGYDARWTATDQIPQRLVDAGSYNGQPFDRFDTLDPTTGGSTARHSLSGEWHDNGDDGRRTRVSAYSIAYRLDLYSNFTYALERPDTGDQFHQRDRRNIFGADASHAWPHSLFGIDARSEVGAQWRHDRIRVGLFDSQARQLVASTRDDRVRQNQFGVWAQTALSPAPWLRSVLGVRADRLQANVTSLDLPANNGHAADTQISPKLSLVLGPWASTEFFFNAGRGMHSNDARGTTARIDPKSGAAVAQVPPLVASRGIEVGARTEVLPGLQSSLAVWQLRSDSELVYIGDAGVTEASGASRRRGVEWNNRFTPRAWLLIDADLAWSHGRFTHGERIPNSIDRVASLAATLRGLGGWSATLQGRYLGSGALVEDDSVRSRASFSTNLRLSKQVGSAAEITLDVFNLFDRKLDDIQYFYESRLPGEPDAVADRHVHPAEPRTVRLTLRASF